MSIALTDLRYEQLLNIQLYCTVFIYFIYFLLTILT